MVFRTLTHRNEFCDHDTHGRPSALSVVKWESSSKPRDCSMPRTGKRYLRVKDIRRFPACGLTGFSNKSRHEGLERLELRSLCLA